MKFGKLLKDLTETNPQMSQQPLIRYKELKKHLKNIKKQQDAAGAAGEGENPAAGAQPQQLQQQQPQPQQQEQQQPAAAPQPQQQPGQQQQQQQQPAGDEVAGYQPGQELPADLSAEEQAFINMLNEDLLGFNRFFMDKEEEAVITLQALADRIEGSKGQQPVEAQELKAALVDFHGEMVLLLHWSLLNYAAVVKILKKHDKQSGLLLRAPYLANVLQQPFYSTSIMSRLVKMAEGHIESLVAQEPPPPAAADTAAAAAEGSSRQQTPEAAGGAAAAAVAGPGPSSEAAAAAGSSKHDSGGTDQQQPQQQPDALLDAAAAGGAAAAGDAAAAGLNAEADTDTDTEELLAGTAVCARTRVALQTWQQLCSNASTPSTILPANSSQALVRALNVRQRWAKLVSMAPIMQQAGMEASAQLGGDVAADSTAAAAAADGGGGQEEGDSGGGSAAVGVAGAAATATAGQAAADVHVHAGQKHKDETADEGQGASAAEPSKRQKVDS